MSLISKAALFVIRELSRPALEKCGEHIGDAAGKVLGRKIDPKPPEVKKNAEGEKVETDES